MKRLLNALAVGLALTVLTLFAARGTARMRVGDDALQLAVKPAERNPWTNLEMNNRPGTFASPSCRTARADIGPASSRAPCG